MAPKAKTAATGGFWAKFPPKTNSLQTKTAAHRRFLVFGLSRSAWAGPNAGQLIQSMRGSERLSILPRETADRVVGRYTAEWIGCDKPT
jgi:hypothetical protein